MRLITTLVCGLLAPLALGAAHGLAQQKPHFRTQRRSQLASASTTDDGPVINSNWAGAVHNGSDIVEVTGTFKMPTVTYPKNAPEYVNYGVSFWVGLDGVDCEAILQIGVDGTGARPFSPGYYSWFEWWPEYSSYDYSVQISPGDEIRLTVRATSATTGSALLEDLTTGQNLSHFFTSTTTQKPLCMSTAEWIVEDFSSGGPLLPFADFSNVTFTNSSFTTKDGEKHGVNGSTIYELDHKTGDKVKTSCRTIGDSEVFCERI